MLKIKSEAGVGLRRIGALYAAYGQVKGDVNGGFDVFFVQQRPKKCRRKHVPRPVKHISQNGGNDVLRTAMRVLRSNNFARRIQSFAWVFTGNTALILPRTCKVIFYRDDTRCA